MTTLFRLMCIVQTVYTSAVQRKYDIMHVPYHSTHVQYRQYGGPYPISVQYNTWILGHQTMLLVTDNAQYVNWPQFS